MPRLLRRIDAREVSLVERAANRRKFALLKARNSTHETPEEGSNMKLLEDAREGIAGIRTALNSGEIGDAADLLDTLEGLLEAALSEEDEEAKAARRRPEDEDEDGKPNRKPATKTERLIEQQAKALVQKSAGTERPLTKEQAIATVLRHNPELWEDHDKEYYATRR
ncbi:MAG: hypothetical protein RDU83_06220 [bacterium]|nr:hypothetical protein [bacterium]